MLSVESLVVRDKIEQLASVSSLVVGDVVVLRTGDRVPADLRLVEVRSLRVDQAALTGESEPVKSSPSCTDDNYLQTRNIAFCGTHVVEGSARGVVVSTGNQTIMGSIASAASASPTRTSSLQLEVRRVVLVILALASITAIGVVFTWAFWLRVDKPAFMSLPSMLATIMGIMVAYLPDGLPFAIVLALTLIARQMARSSVVVKHLPIVETLGTVDVLASDKTGTLTQNKMSVVNLFMLPSELVAVPDSKKVLQSKKKAQDREPQLHKLVQLASLCSGASFDESMPSEEAINVHSPVLGHATDAARIIGDASDSAIMRFAATNTDLLQTRSKWFKLFEIPFNSKNKWMLTVHAIPSDFCSDASADSTSSDLYDGVNARAASDHLKNKALLIMKGAGEIIAARCWRFLDPDGCVRPLTDTMRQTLVQQQDLLGSQGRRVIGIGYSEFSVNKSFPLFSKKFDEDQEQFTVPAVSQDLIFVCFMALMDPPRSEVPPAIDTLRTAGVRVMMVTGDHATTALAIARQVGLVRNPSVEAVTKETISTLVARTPAESLCASSVYFHDPSKALFGEGRKYSSSQARPVPQKAITIAGTDMAEFDGAAWDWVIAHDEVVFSRTTPEDKLRIVAELQKRNHVVAVTGDGVNDAPALRQAEAGIAMGGGSDVAKEAASIVLTDNNFASILVAVEYGRLVFDNLTKVLLYLFPSGSFSEVIPVILNVWFGLPLPLSAFLMIYLACVTDIGPALALIKEKSEGNLMIQPPRRKQEHLVRFRTFLHAYGYLGVVEAFGALTMYFWYMSDYAGLGIRDLFFAFDAFNQDGFAGSSNTASDLQEYLRTAQSVYFVAVVVMQLGNLLATRTQYRSFFSFNPMKGAGKNPAIFIAMVVAVAFAALIVYVPPFNAIFGTRPIPFQFWFLPLIFSTLIFCLDEIRKVLVRNFG